MDETLRLTPKVRERMVKEWNRLNWEANGHQDDRFLTDSFTIQAHAVAKCIRYLDEAVIEFRKQDNPAPLNEWRPVVDDAWGWKARRQNQLKVNIQVGKRKIHRAIVLPDGRTAALCTMIQEKPGKSIPWHETTRHVDCANCIDLLERP